jgi:hypothetical protein
MAQSVGEHPGHASFPLPSVSGRGMGFVAEVRAR